MWDKGQKDDQPSGGNSNTNSSSYHRGCCNNKLWLRGFFVCAVMSIESRRRLCLLSASLALDHTARHRDERSLVPFIGEQITDRFVL